VENHSETEAIKFLRGAALAETTREELDANLMFHDIDGCAETERSRPECLMVTGLNRFYVLNICIWQGNLGNGILNGDPERGLSIEQMWIVSIEETCGCCRAAEEGR
jgi:hypothetical protein